MEGSAAHETTTCRQLPCPRFWCVLFTSRHYWMLTTNVLEVIAFFFPSLSYAKRRSLHHSPNRRPRSVVRMGSATRRGCVRRRGPIQGPSPRVGSPPERSLSAARPGVKASSFRACRVRNGQVISRETIPFPGMRGDLQKGPKAAGGGSLALLCALAIQQREAVKPRSKTLRASVFRPLFRRSARGAR